MQGKVQGNASLSQQDYLFMNVLTVTPTTVNLWQACKYGNFKFNIKATISIKRALAPRACQGACLLGMTAGVLLTNFWFESDFSQSMTNNF